MSVTDRLGLSISQAVLAWVLVALIGGVAGLTAMLLCNYMLSFGGSDSADKHGISNVKATRLGGVAIVAYVAMHLGYQAKIGIYVPPQDDFFIMMISGAFFAIGLSEDLLGVISTRLRFVLMLVIAWVSLYVWPVLTLQPVNIAWVDALLSLSPLVATFFTGVCLAFIPNAFNTADGANGLVSGCSIFLFAAMLMVAPAALIPFLSASLVGCLIFLVFNLISGRFFLGDGGAYFLGALSGLSLIVVANKTDVSAWWLLAFVFYPAADLIWSMGRRVVAGESPFKPDNQHFHNLLFALLDRGQRSSTVINSITGITIALLFSGLPLLSTLWLPWSPKEDIWLLWVCIQWVTYGVGWKLMSDRLCALPEKVAQM